MATVDPLRMKSSEISSQTVTFTERICRIGPHYKRCGRNDCPTCDREELRARSYCNCDYCIREAYRLQDRISRFNYYDSQYRRGASMTTTWVDETMTWGIDTGYVPKQLTSGDDMNLVDKVKNLKLSAADKLLRKHNVVDAEGDLTSTGKDLVWTKLLDQFKDDIVADLKAVDKETKEKK